MPINQLIVKSQGQPCGTLLKLPVLASGGIICGSYVFSKPLNLLEFDPSYPRNPKTLGDYIRKWRMKQGLLIRELAQKLGVTEDTVINWEIRGMVPTKRHLERVERAIPGLAAIIPDSYQKIAG